jgi:lipoyl-dependent peroxiredoxin
VAERNANATWEGDLLAGAGVVSAASTGLFTDAPVTWASRTEDAGGRTSPEELLAAAHAACFSMALSNELASRGHVPERVEVSAVAVFEAPTITTMRLHVVATVPGADEAQFREALAAAEGGGCPVSNALRGNVDIQVEAELV